MKKIIESELISIAHRILKLKDKSDINSLYNESKNVFEKIAVLKFYEDNKFRIDPSIKEENIRNAFLNLNNIELKKTEEKVVFASETSSMSLELINELIEDSENSDIVSFDEPISKTSDIELQSNQNQEKQADDVEVQTIKEPTITELNLPVFEIDPLYTIPIEEIYFEQKREDVEFFVGSQEVTEGKSSLENQHFIDSTESNEIPFHQIPLNKTINDAFSHLITIGLNDRIAFEKNLFNGSSEDLNRVISQLNTLESFQEAQDFLEDLVKPDFNYWKGKEEFEERFMELIQKRF